MRWVDGAGAWLEELLPAWFTQYTALTVICDCLLLLAGDL